MKLAYFESTGRWGAGAPLLLLLLSLLGRPFAAMATDPIWNSADHGSFFVTPPQIDATNFNNTGYWVIQILTFPASPYKTSHTVNYTNNGTMQSYPGWEFDFGPTANGGRGWAGNFVNGSSGTIQALDLTLPNILQLPVDESFLLISATNIVNRGLLTAGSSGELIMRGANVNLSHSELEITPIIGNGGAVLASNIFLPDTGISDAWWTAGTNKFTATGPPWDGFMTANFFANGVQEPCGVNDATITINPFVPTASDSLTTNIGPHFISLTNNAGLQYTNVLVFSNTLSQAAFVLTGSGLVPQIRFTPSVFPSNSFHNVAVQLAAVINNSITAQPETNTIYFVDDLAASTNRGLSRNPLINPLATCSDATFRPGNFIVSRQDISLGGVFTFAGGTNGLGPPPSTFYYDPLTFSNFVAVGVGDTYSANIDNVPVENAPSVSVTNLTGRLHIYADNLNLNQTHVRAEGQIVIQTTNLTSSANATMDCQNLSFNLGSTTGGLTFTNFATPVVDRLNGSIKAFSALWTNNTFVIYTNNYVTNSSGIPSNVFWIQSPVTNVGQVILTITLLDASGLLTTRPVIVQDLVLHSTNMVVSDSMNVVSSLLFDGQSLTLNGTLTLSGGFLFGINSTGIQNWVYTNAPTLRFFTNNGSLSIPNSAHFGDDGPTNYLVFVNNGSISAGGQHINSVNLQINNGFDQSYADVFSAQAQTGQLNGAIILALSGIQFTANTLQINSSTLSTSGSLDFSVPNLSDGGPGLANFFHCEAGFNLWTQPVTGALLGTIIDDAVPGQAEVDHFWSGKELGPNAGGFVNNAGINTLVLDPMGPQTPGFEPLFAFFGTAGTLNGNAMYVSNLDLSLLTDYANEIEIDPTLTIYFATAELSPSVVIAPFPDPEHFLDGKFGGHLRWVGVTSFRHSSALTRKFQLSVNYDAAAHQLQVAQNLMPGQTNIIEASTDLFNWIPVSTNIGSYTNLGSAIITDTNSQSYKSRFYRLKILP